MGIGYRESLCGEIFGKFYCGVLGQPFLFVLNSCQVLQALGSWQILAYKWWPACTCIIGTWVGINLSQPYLQLIEMMKCLKYWPRYGEIEAFTIAYSVTYSIIQVIPRGLKCIDPSFHPRGWNVHV